MNSKTYKRICRRCGKPFLPTGKYSYICGDCRGRGIHKHVDRVKTIRNPKKVIMKCPYAKNGYYCDHYKNGFGNHGDKIICKFRNNITECPLLKESTSKVVDMLFLEKSALEEPQPSPEVHEDDR